MSIISLLNEQLKNTLNRTTKDLILSVSNQFNLPYKELLNIWNEVNPSFKHNFETKVTIEDDIKEHKITIEDDDDPRNIVVEKPEDEDVIVVKRAPRKIVIED